MSKIRQARVDLSNALQWRLESSTVKSRSGHSCSPLPDGSKLLIWGGRKSNDVDYVLVRSVVSSHYSFPPKQGPKGNSYHTGWFLLLLLLVLLLAVVIEQAVIVVIVVVSGTC